MGTLALVLAGAALGGAFARLAFSRGGQGALTLALGLAVAAAIYVGLAATGGAPARWLLLEAFGLVAFGTVAFLGYRRSPSWLAAGWALHALWDAPLHLSVAAATYTPGWYPPLCFGFDLVAAAAAAVLTARTRAVHS